MDEDRLRRNLEYFLKVAILVVEKCSIKIAAMIDSESNGVTIYMGGRRLSGGWIVRQNAGGQLFMQFAGCDSSYLRIKIKGDVRYVAFKSSTYKRTEDGMGKSRYFFVPF
jgi:hypothetical protein